MIAICSFLFLVLVIPFTLFLSQQQQNYHQYAATTTYTPLGVPGSWNLAFDDEFNGNSLDLTKWYPSRTDAISEPYNSDENAAYDPAQNTVSNGVLQQTLINSPVTVGGKTYKYRTGNIMSRNFKFVYGVLEARIYLPAAGNGQVANWPAWWASGDNWPQDGEIDIMEGLSGKAAWHYYCPTSNPGGTPAGTFTGWHVFSIDRESTFLKYYYDGVLVGTVTSGLTSAGMRIIAGNQSGLWGGPLLVPSTMQIDYIRVWQLCTANCSTTPAATPTPLPKTQATPTAVLSPRQPGEKQPTPTQPQTLIPTWYCGGSQNCVPSNIPTPTIFGVPPQSPNLPPPQPSSGTQQPPDQQQPQQPMSGILPISQHNGKHNQRMPPGLAKKMNNGNQQGFNTLFQQLINWIQQLISQLGPVPTLGKIQQGNHPVSSVNM